MPFVQVDYYGLPALRLVSPFLEVDVLAEAGPRLVRLALPGGANLLAETPAQGWPMRWGQFHLYGGHRLWNSPESELSGYPDDGGLQVFEISDGLRLVGARVVDGAVSLQKEMRIHLAGDHAGLVIEHVLRNEGAEKLRCAAWAITQFPQGGAAEICIRQDGMSAGRLPDRMLALWPYSSVSDARLAVEDEVIRVKAAPGAPLKVGAFSPAGAVRYSQDGVTVDVHFDPAIDLPHTDWGCNAEIYSNDRFIELETLGPLVELNPGQETTHTETWRIRRVQSPT